MDNLINTSLPASIRTGYQSAVTKTVAEVVAGTKTAEQALNDTLMQWAKDGFTGFRDKAGRQWKVDNYARTIIKSTTRRAYNEARMAPARELGIDTFYYSMKSSAREMCAPLQHQIVTTGQGRVEEGVRVLALSDYGWGTPGGCLGVNCGHDLTPFIPGANLLPELPEHLKNLTPEQAIQNANAEAKQRALERNIRRNKELLHVARQLGDKELVQKYRLRGATLNDAMKDWLDKPPHLKRDKAREKYHDDPYTKAKKNIELRALQEKVTKEYERAKELLGKKAPKSLSEFKKMGYNNTKQYRQILLKSDLQEQINNGELSLVINQDKQNRHAKDHKSYAEYVARSRGKNHPIPGYITVDNDTVQKIINDNYLDGTIVKRQKGQYSSIIKIDTKSGVAYGRSDLAGAYPTETNEFTIHISKATTHLVPKMPSNNNEGGTQ